MESTTNVNDQLIVLDHAVRMFYDIQKLRIQSRQRDTAITAELTDEDRAFMAELSAKLKESEKITLKRINAQLKGIPIYEEFLRDQKGVGPTMAGVLVSRIDPHLAPTVSSLWKFCGLAVDEGQAQRLKKGEKASYDPFLKAKVVKVLAESFIKSNSPWREFYDNYKHRKMSQRVATCQACKGAGVFKSSKNGKTQNDEGGTCGNCNGTGGPAPWGRSQQHRNVAAKRYMMKMFLKELHVRWRTLEGLPVRPSYQEQYLGHTHTDK